jgi:hypothetical protein
MTAPVRWSRDERFARHANVVAAGVRNGDMQAEDALRVLKHQLRIFNWKQAMKITRRSTGAQWSIKEHDGAPPKNGSGSALHSDHVHPLNRDQLFKLTSVDMCLAVPDQLREVVCVTADENERLRRVEAREIVGWAKYPEASVELVQQDGEDWVPLD